MKCQITICLYVRIDFVHLLQLDLTHPSYPAHYPNLPDLTIDPDPNLDRVVDLLHYSTQRHLLTSPINQRYLFRLSYPNHHYHPSLDSLHLHPGAHYSIHLVH